ncbi:MAG: mannitol dehydrogenase family protein [Halioglobus sp.]
MQRLHPQTLGELPAAVTRPDYDRDATGIGMLHLGIGAFHRAHQAVYTDTAMALAGGDWGIVGVSLRSAAVSDQMMPQDCLYSVMTEDATASHLRVVGAVKRVLVAPRNPAAVVASLADPSVQIVTLTITEKGYKLAADGNTLNREDEDVIADLANPEQPRTALGLLALGLRARAAAGAAALTILSCDNLSGNSHRLRGVLQEYLADTFVEVLPWLDQQVRFPCCMVDRIVPAMTAEQSQRQSRALGLTDAAGVSTEPFSQWIIEDDFATARPAWERAGAQFVSSVLPYEAIKLRLLNASHSAIAYCGLLAELETVDAVMGDAELRAFIEALMTHELMPALTVPADFDIAAYRDQLLQRFANPCLHHRCAQIAMDGSEKISQRWLPGLQQSRGEGQVKALAAWCYFILHSGLTVDDPQATELLAARASTEPVDSRVAQVLDCARINAGSVADFAPLVTDIVSGMANIERQGIRAMLAATDSANT